MDPFIDHDDRARAALTPEQRERCKADFERMDKALQGVFLARTELEELARTMVVEQANFKRFDLLLGLGAWVLTAAYVASFFAFWRPIDAMCALVWGTLCAYRAWLSHLLRLKIGAAAREQPPKD